MFWNDGVLNVVMATVKRWSRVVCMSACVSMCVCMHLFFDERAKQGIAQSLTRPKSCCGEEWTVTARAGSG